MIIHQTSYARAGLAGNPSDLFNGKTLSVLFDHFEANVTLYETPRLRIIPGQRDQSDFDDIHKLVDYRKQYGYYGGLRLLEALIVRFYDHCRENDIRIDHRNFTVEYDSNIPFAVGLAGSTAIVTALFKALMAFYELSDEDIPRPIQANIILEAETRELDIHAGPQDRVVSVYGGLVYMDFSETAYEQNYGAHGNYKKLDAALLPPLFVAYNQECSQSSGKTHDVVRFQHTLEHNRNIRQVMKKKADLVDEAYECLTAGTPERLGPIMDRDFDLRKSIYDISPANLEMIQIARDCDAHAKFTGSGGAVLGVYRDAAHLRELADSYAKAGYEFLKARPIL